MTPRPELPAKPLTASRRKASPYINHPIVLAHDLRERLAYSLGAAAYGMLTRSLLGDLIRSTFDAGRPEWSTG